MWWGVVVGGVGVGGVGDGGVGTSLRRSEGPVLAKPAPLGLRCGPPSRPLRSSRAAARAPGQVGSPRLFALPEYLPAPQSPWHSDGIPDRRRPGNPPRSAPGHAKAPANHSRGTPTPPTHHTHLHTRRPWHPHKPTSRRGAPGGKIPPEMRKGHPIGVALHKDCPAVSYSPTPSPVQYHRR
ncbi:hypothetical protein Misp03_76360 [Microbispora sp. NBRC 16548]|nr:hypothetical protein Misp03_76360 [Microbispora sp. NBRC 16548]